MGLLKKECKNSHANVVDGKLILACPDAVSPVVWQMDLSVANASALEVQTQENGQALLVLKSGKTANTPVAIFDRKDKAVAALMVASTAMQSAHGKINTAASGATTLQAPTRHVPEKKGGFFRVLFKAIAVLAILFLGYSILMVITGSKRSSQPSSAQNSAQTQSGQPMSADDFLRSQ